MGQDITLTASDNFQTGRLSRRPRRHAQGRGGGDPGNLWRQSSHPRGLRPLRRARLRRHRAFDLRPHRTQFPVRLHPGGSRDRAQIRGQSGLGRDAARHPGRHRCGKGCRPGRHRRLLSRRQRGLCRGDQTVGPDRRRSAITAAPSCASPTTSRKCRRNCISAKRTPAFRSAMSRPSAPSGPRSRSTSIPARSTVLIARNAPATTRPAPTSRGSAASAFFAKHLKKYGQRTSFVPKHPPGIHKSALRLDPGFASFARPGMTENSRTSVRRRARYRRG